MQESMNTINIIHDIEIPTKNQKKKKMQIFTNKLRAKFQQFTENLLANELRVRILYVMIQFSFDTSIFDIRLEH